VNGPGPTGGGCRTLCLRRACGGVLLLLAGCGPGGPAGPAPAAAAPRPAESDPEKVRSSDVSVLFVGNSHTTFHDVPGLVGWMIRFRHPERSVYSHVVAAAFLDTAAADPRCRDEIDTRPWKAVVLQAQRISASGSTEYSRAEGVDLAERARARGAAVFFFSEWGLQGVPGDGPRMEAIYQGMARAAGARVAPVGRAWDLALSRRPGLPLYAPDGNHESALGAFLTAAVLYGALTGESSAALADFPYPGAGEEDRRLLASAAAEAVAPAAGGAGR
jgi:hypothetical protein